jgi:hypothetical protein
VNLLFCPYFNHLFHVSIHWYPPCLGILGYLFQSSCPTHDNSLPHAWT